MESTELNWRLLARHQWPLALSLTGISSVLRLTQESLTNTRKHAAAVSSVEVSLSSRDGLLFLVVSDDGMPSAAPVGGSGGYGLVGMRERVELLGGTFSAGRREPTGWTVRAELPIS